MWVRFPHGVWLLDARDTLAWGTVRDELDVSYLVEYVLEPVTSSTQGP